MVAAFLGPSEPPGWALGGGEALSRGLGSGGLDQVPGEGLARERCFPLQCVPFLFVRAPRLPPPPPPGQWALTTVPCDIM